MCRLDGDLTLHTVSANAVETEMRPRLLPFLRFSDKWEILLFEHLIEQGKPIISAHCSSISLLVLSGFYLNTLISELARISIVVARMRYARARARAMS